MHWSNKRYQMNSCHIIKLLVKFVAQKGKLAQKITSVVFLFTFTMIDNSCTTKMEMKSNLLNAFL